MKKAKKRIILMASLVSIGFVAVISVTSQAKSPYEKLRIFAQVLAHLERSYVEPVKGEELVYGAIRGMMRTLDPHSAFLMPDEMEMLESDTKGRFGGVGLEVGIQDGMLTVITPIENSPAERVGVQPGDVILAIEGQPTQDMSLMDAVRLMRGEPGTKVTVTLRREGEAKPFDVTFERAIVKVESVEAELMEPGYPLIRVRMFQTGTSAEVRREFERLEREGGKIKGIVMDLRRNPGGVFREAVLLADLFVKSGVIVTTRGRNEKIVEEYRAKRRGTFDDVPMVTLIDGASASAAEIVAGALQDNGRSLLVGMKSFGKGSVQSIVELGAGFGMKLTVARYFTPSGRSIQVSGVSPDVVIESVNPPAPDPVTEAIASSQGEGGLAGHLAPVGSLKSDANESTIDDFQLRVAFQLLTGMARAKDAKN
jgi:carboxyl-terminal processing protease